ncbi:MAG: nucleoside triphosphate pyrophosphohydrolase [Candidatus Dependentiae bacterium]|nr:nucleoside triphosphate pyrophosphohydrolase [Candidatus Dependentiae bacterium]
MAMKKNIAFLTIILFVVGCYFYMIQRNQATSTSSICDETIEEHKNEDCGWDQKRDITATTSYVPQVQEGVKRRKFLQNKLWRDNAAKQLEEQDGAVINRIILDDEEYNKQLGLKLIEEAHEVAAAKNKKELACEMGDVFEVLECLMKLHNISKDEVIAAQDKKRADRGSFLNREFVLSSEYLPGSFGEWYSLKDSRLVEIFD